MIPNKEEKPENEQYRFPGALILANRVLKNTTIQVLRYIKGATRPVKLNLNAPNALMVNFSTLNYWDLLNHSQFSGTIVDIHKVKTRKS